MVRNGNAWTIYLNGKSDATATNAADAGFDSTNPLHIMRWNNSNGTIAGNVADFRFVKVRQFIQVILLLQQLHLQQLQTQNYLYRVQMQVLLIKHRAQNLLNL